MLRTPSCNSFVLLTFLSKDRLGGLRYTIVLFTAAARPFGSLGLCAARWRRRHGAHSANFDEKVHKPQSKFYGRIGANMKLF
jgi:hypothetical protein